MNLSPTNIRHIGSINRGILVETSTVSNAIYLTNGGTATIFKVYGKIKVLSLEWEAMSTAAADAYTMQFKYVSTDPVVSTAQISNASSSIANLGRGGRVTLMGTALSTAALLSVPGISFSTSTFLELGIQDGEGNITALGAGASQSSGTGKWSLCYVPMSEGAYAEACF